MSNSTYILSAKRTPIGSFMGSLSTVPAPQLGAQVIKSALETAHIPLDKVDECIMGQVLTSGSGQAPARQAAIFAGVDKSTPCMTINKVCGSGLKAVMLASDSIQLGRSHIAVAGGQENMSLSPHILLGSRTGTKMGAIKTADTMINDGLWDPYNNFHMGNAAESCVKEYQFSREEQDAFAIESYKRSQKSIENNVFKNEITPVEVPSRKETLTFSVDEEPSRVKFDKIAALRPAFDKDGAITAANASTINDGAAALVLASEWGVKKFNAKPIAKIVAQATFAQDPVWFTTAPVEAMKMALEKAQLKVEDIDLWEINEAFSVVTMAAMKSLNIDHDKVNINGGAVSLGHPIGASGARIFTTLIHSLHQTQKKYGMASLCIGGGEAVAVIVERV